MLKIKCVTKKSMRILFYTLSSGETVEKLLTKPLHFQSKSEAFVSGIC